MKQETYNQIHTASNKVQGMLGKISKMFAVVLAIIGASGCATKIQVTPPAVVSCVDYLKDEALTYTCGVPANLETADVFERGLYAGIDARNKLSECSLKLQELQTVLRVCKVSSDRLKQDLELQHEQK